MTEQANEIAILTKQARACNLCADKLPLGPKPIIQTHHQSKILIVSQAPGSIAHHSGVPFMDKSGERLRDWMGISQQDFYDAKNVAIVPMGFCYPGKAKSGDIAPPIECAKKWQAPFQSLLPNIRLRLLIGLHSQRWHLGKRNKSTLTLTVKNWREYVDAQQTSSDCKYGNLLDFPLPHPSPRNNIWMAKNPWFTQDVVPYLQEKIALILRDKE